MNLEFSCRDIQFQIYYLEMLDIRLTVDTQSPKAQRNL